MSQLHPLDHLEVNLRTGSTPGTTADLLKELDLPSAMEFSILRWIWWRDHGEDLIERLPALGHWPALCTLEAINRDWELLDPFVARSSSRALRDTHLGVQELPFPGKEWGAGGAVLFFQERFKAALLQAGMDANFSRALVGAVKEMASNAVEHAVSPILPLACFEVGRKTWSFGVTDAGRGSLGSIRENPAYADLKGEVEALRAVLQDGVSRTGEPGRGYGFARVFKALVDRQASLRFRSGGACARWHGKSPTAQTITFQALPLSRAGFHIQVGGPLQRSA